MWPLIVYKVDTLFQATISEVNNLQVGRNLGLLLGKSTTNSHNEREFLAINISSSLYNVNGILLFKINVCTVLLTCLRKIPYRPVGLKMTLSLRCTLEPRWKNEVLPSRRRCTVAIGYQYPTYSLKTSFCKQSNWNWEEMFIDNRQSPEQPKSVKKYF